LSLLYKDRNAIVLVSFIEM